MVATPKFLDPMNTLRETWYFTTSRGNRFFSGVISTDTIDLQVSINQTGFTSDPDFVFFEGSSFIIPNPSAYPEGMSLLPGKNTVEVRAISTTGAISAIALANAQLILEKDIGVVLSPPTGLSMEQLDGAVKISLIGSSDTNIKGYNFYASTAPGGGLSGYKQLNANLIASGQTTEALEELGNLAVDAVIKTNLDGTKAADPLYVKITGVEEDSQETLLQTDFNERLEIPEYVSTIRSSLTINSVSLQTIYSFTHDRSADFTSAPSTIPNNEFSTILEDDYLYYIVTAVYFDATSQLEIESPFSSEVVGHPLTISTAVGSLPVVRRNQIVQETTLSIYRSQPQISVQAGSYTKDVFIDPFSTEAERIRFIVDFLHQAQSFSTLLAIDDPNFSGTSIPVQQSSYKVALKQAFFFTEDVDVQNMIDAAFEALASRFGTSRKFGIRSRGECTFFLTTKPSQTFPIAIGSVILGGGIRFRTVQAAEISVLNIASFYSPVTGRYSVRVSLEAEEEGGDGNLAIGQINQLESPLANLFVTNEAPTFGGKGQESNLELAIRCMGILSSVDTGTRRGYHQKAITFAGVEEASVTESGNAIMQRDFDVSTQQHLGGKVDIWVRGELVSSVTDNFAFSFEIAKDIQFEIIGNPADLEFRAVDSNLTSVNPIIEMLDYASYGFLFRNASTGVVYDLTSVQITAYNTIKLDATANATKPVSLTDVVFGDYRYRNSDKFIFSRQPVREIDFLTGEVTGEVDPDIYALYHPKSPLGEGRSILAGDYIQITDPQDPGVQIPSGSPVVISNESHIILGNYIEYLDNLGINPLTVVVWNEDRTATYVSPFSTGTPDYTIIVGTSTSPLGIQRTTASLITSGESLSIDYQHDENFVVGYTSNLLVKLLQEYFNDNRHLTADVLVKEAIAVGVDITGTVVLEKISSLTESLNTSLVDVELRTNIQNYFNTLRLGGSLRQSDVTSEIDSTDRVSYVEIPLTLLAKSEGSPVTRESLTTTQTSDSTLVLDWSTANVVIYLLHDALDSVTTTGGGPNSEFRGVFQTDSPLQLITSNLSSSGSPLNGSVGNSYIIGNNGMVIPGLTDDTTLLLQAPFTNTSENLAWVEERRKEITANRVMVSLMGGVSKVVDEQKLLTGTSTAFLSLLNAYASSVVVRNLTRTVTYLKDVDYEIVIGGAGIPVGIRRKTGGGITSGAVVSVDYKYASAIQDTPVNYLYTCTYVVGVETGSKNLSLHPPEYFVLGNLDLSYDEDVA